MTLLKCLKPLHPGCATDCDLKMLVCSKNQNNWSSKERCFCMLFHVIITNEVPVTILQTYMPLSRYIRKGVLIERNIGSDLCTTLGCQQFCKESRKRLRRIMFERNYSFFHHYLYSLVVALCSKNTKMGGTGSR